MKANSVVLRDGSVVLIRQVKSGYARLMAEGFARLSAESRRLRFLMSKSSLTPAEQRYFTALVSSDSPGVQGLLRESLVGARVIDRESGAVEYEIPLPLKGIGNELGALLRAFGRRQVKAPAPIHDTLVGLTPEDFTGQVGHVDHDACEDGEVEGGTHDRARVESPHDDRRLSSYSCRG